MYILQMFIIGYCCLLASYLLSRPKQLQHTLLAVFLLTVALIIGLNHSVEVGWLTAKPTIREYLPLILGPLFYGFVKALVTAHWQLRWYDSAHLAILPSWALLRYALPTDWHQLGLLALTFGQFSVYLVFALKLCRQRQRLIDAQMGISQSTSLHWIQRTAAGFLLMVLLEITELLLDNAGIFVSQSLYVADMLLLALLFAGLVYEAIRQPDFLAALEFEPAQPKAAHSATHAAVTVESTPEATTEVTFDPAQLQALEQYLSASKIYRQPNLTLQQLASAMNLPARQISAMVNQGFSRNFSDFINGYRVREAAQLLLAEPPPDNLLTLLYQVGFNSKSTFNLMFKREFNCTPSQYRVRHQLQHSE